MKGNAIIVNMLLGLFPQQTTPIDAFYPLSHTQFFMFVLVPYIGTELIAEDLGCSLEEANHHMIKSCRTGTILYPECDDNEVDALCRRNIAAFKLSRLKAKGKQRETKTEVDESVQAAAAALLELNMVFFLLSSAESETNFHTGRPPISDQTQQPLPKWSSMTCSPKSRPAPATVRAFQ